MNSKYLKLFFIITLIIIFSRFTYSNWLGIELTGKMHFLDSIYSNGNYGALFLSPEISIIINFKSIKRYGFISYVYAFFDISLLKGKREIEINILEGIKFKDEFIFKSFIKNLCIGYMLKFKRTSYIPFFGISNILLKEKAFGENYKKNYYGFKTGIKTEIKMNKKGTFNTVFKVSLNKIIKSTLKSSLYVDLSIGVNLFFNPFKRRFN